MTLHDYLVSKQNEATELLCALVRVPSIKSAPLPGAPFGKASRDAIELAAEIYRAHGFESRVYDSGYALSEGPGSDRTKTIGIFAHADVVPVDDRWTYTKPFDPIVKDNWVIGRGASDNKSGVILSLLTAMAIRDLGLPFKSRLLLYTGSNEEAGMDDIRAFAAEQPMPDASLVPDSGFPIECGEKSILRFFAVSKDALPELLSFEGGQAPNIVLGTVKVKLRFTEALAAELTAAQSDRMTVARDGDTLVLTAYGMSVHALNPGGGLSAAKVACDALLSCPSLSETTKKVLACASRMTGDIYGNDLGFGFKDPHFGTLTFANGIASLRDGHLALSFDCRFGVAKDHLAVERQITETLASLGWSVEVLSNRAGFLRADDNPCRLALLEAYRQASGNPDAKSFVAGGGTYSRYLDNGFGIGPCVKPKNKPFPLAPGHGDAHQPDECAYIPGILDAVELVVPMLLALDGTLNPD